VQNQESAMPPERKLIVYIAMSLDGYIAKPNEDLSFLSLVQLEGEDYGYEKFSKTIDTVIMGRKTYDWVMKQVPVFPHADKETYIISRMAKPGMGTIQYYSGSIKDLVSRLKRKSGKNIFVDGGAEIVNLLLHDLLIDEWIISVIPILLGAGVRLFKDGRPEQKLSLVQTMQFKTGLVQLHYERADS
jgi:dihydrofolate reductase